MLFLEFAGNSNAYLNLSTSKKSVMSVHHLIQVNWDQNLLVNSQGCLKVQTLKFKSLKNNIFVKLWNDIRAVRCFKLFESNARDVLKGVSKICSIHKGTLKETAILNSQ